MSNYTIQLVFMQGLGVWESAIKTLLGWPRGSTCNKPLLFQLCLKQV
jgi:hypothetical protein